MVPAVPLDTLRVISKRFVLFCLGLSRFVLGLSWFVLVWAFKSDPMFLRLEAAGLEPHTVRISVKKDIFFVFFLFERSACVKFCVDSPPIFSIERN